MYRIVLRDEFKKRHNIISTTEIIEEIDLGKFDETNMAISGVNRNIQRNIALFFDNLKPIQRRLLLVMAQMKLWPSSDFDSCAGVVGQTLTKYSPHGDAATWTALVYMRQPWRHLIPLIDIKGNYGNCENPDAYAQMRYVKCKLSEFSVDCFFSEWDLKSKLVDMRPSYNGKDMEPIYLPAKYPLFLMSWGSGLGYGISTASPGFLPQDAFNAVIALLDNPNADIILYPEDPLGCTILNKKIFKKFVDYNTKKDDKNLAFRVRSTYSVDDNKIIIHNTPYEVNPLAVCERIKELVKTNKIEGLEDMEVKLKKGSIPQLRNNEDTAEIILELKKGYDPHIMMDKLYKLTNLESTYPLNCVYVNDNKNDKYNLRDSILNWIHLRRKVLKRLYRIELNSFQKRLMVLNALLMLFETNSIDKVVKIFKTNKRDKVHDILIKEFSINDYQAKQISAMRLSDLSTDAYEGYKGEKKKTLTEIKRIQEILEHKKNIDTIIADQMREGIKKYSRTRLSKVIDSTGTNDDDDTLYNICITDTGYIKKLPLEIQEFGKLADDSELIAIESDITSSTKLVMFNEVGKVFGEFVNKLPVSKLDGVGYNMKKDAPMITELVGAIPIEPNDTNSSIICVTKMGIVKRSKSADYFAAAMNSTGMKLGKDDVIKSVLQSSKRDDRIAIYTKNGFCVIYRIDEINTTARATSGFSGIKLEADDEVIGAKIIRVGDTHLVTISTKGEVKQFNFESSLSSMKRGSSGLDVMARNENLYNLVSIGPKDELLTIYTSKILAGEALNIDDIPTKTRISTGDKLLNVRRGKELIKTSKQ